jgi:hypothetical protein
LLWIHLNIERFQQIEHLVAISLSAKKIFSTQL